MHAASAAAGPRLKICAGGPVRDGVRDALGQLLDAHDPFPAVLFDADWHGLAMNAGGHWLCGVVMPGFSLAPLAPAGGFDMIAAVGRADGLLSRMHDPVPVAAALLDQFKAEAWARPGLAARVAECEARLTARLGTLPAGERDPGSAHLHVTFDTPHGALSFFTCQMIPGVPQDAGAGSLRLEFWFPRDGRTRAVMERRGSGGLRRA